jgi:NADH-quinone oxidoreductase subunit M
VTDLHLPWLEASILVSLIGALSVSRAGDPHRARNWCLGFSGLVLLCTAGAWLDFEQMNAVQADDAWHLLSRLVGREILVIDQLSAPLLPLVALLYFLTTLTTLSTKVRRFSFVSMLISEAIVLTLFSCKEPWLVIAMLAAGTIPPYIELRSRGQSTRVYSLYMAAYVGLMVWGWTEVEIEGDGRVHSLWAIVPLLGAILIRGGIAPFHSWLTDLFERASLGTALLFATPLTAAYAALRLVLPIAPDWVLRSMGLLSLVTAVYAAGMALVQKDARRFFCYLFLSHSALVFVGLEVVTPIGLTGALCVWVSVVLSLGGFGLTLRALEARRGRLSLAEFQGLYDHAPTLAVCFLLTGLASVGFPGTVGFVGAELLVDGAVETYPYVGVAVVIAAALNGLAIGQAYFKLFTGTKYVSTVSLRIGSHERFAVLTLAFFILMGGLFPQQSISSRYRAAHELLDHREGLSTEPTSDEEHHPSESDMNDNESTEEQ